MRYLWLLMALALTGLIFFNSSLGISDSGRLSAMVAQLVTQLGPLAQLITDGNLEHTIRKLAHFLEFTLLSLLWCKTLLAFRVTNRTATGYILPLCLLTAVLDEYIQLFSAGRGSQVRDVLLDFSGAFCGWLWFRIVQWCE